MVELRLPAVRLMREILGEDYGADDDVEILDGGGCKSESPGSAAARGPSADVVDLCNEDESDADESEPEAAVEPAEAKFVSIKVKKEEFLSSVDAESTSESSDDDSSDSSSEDLDEAWSGSASDSDDSDATVPYCAPKKISRRMPGAGGDRVSARRRPPRGSRPLTR
mmetsp:Transcript_20458/g.46242  ORF Transcript_20458/g.46242 Transcript_20458/m.46242 type:complete len:167 (+) Transcript_20458:3-503(+)